MTLEFVLVSPAIPENIGAAARAMNTMGFTRLRLVNPRNHLDDRARWLAHGSAHVLKNARVFTSLSQALEGIDLSVATTSRRRRLKHEYHPSQGLPELFREKRRSVNTAALVFGSEEHGLSNGDLSACDLVSSIPMARAYPSLNLSHAVMVYAYLLSGFAGKKKQGKRAEAAGPGQFRALIEGCRELFPRIGLRKDAVIFGRILERLSALNGEDIRLAHFIRRKMTEALEI